MGSNAVLSQLLSFDIQSHSRSPPTSLGSSVLLTSRVNWFSVGIMEWPPVGSRWLHRLHHPVSHTATHSQAHVTPARLSVSSSLCLTAPCTWFSCRGICHGLEDHPVTGPPPPGTPHPSWTLCDLVRSSGKLWLSLQPLRLLSRIRAALVLLLL